MSSPHTILETTPASSTVTLDDTVKQQDSPTTRSPPDIPSPPVWSHRLSASFSAMAEQISAASRALAQVPLDAPVNALNTPVVSPEELVSRLDKIEQQQELLGAEIDALKTQIAASNSNTSTEHLEKKLNDIVESLKLDESRLYARLQNSTVTVSKLPIKAPIMANGKIPPNFPATRGEFEHLTKERYEQILKSYDLPVKGDTAAKREAVRAFIGLPP